MIALAHQFFKTKVLFGCRMLLKNVGNFVVAMVIFVPVGFLNCLQYMSLPVHMKETMLCSFYRYTEPGVSSFSYLIISVFSF